MARLRELLAELDLTPLARHKAFTLSGGERRRLEITRALVTEPRYLLLDEPFTGIDPIAIGDIQEIVARLRERGIGVLITDHNVRETLAITDRAYILYDGQILAAGTAPRAGRAIRGPARSTSARSSRSERRLSGAPDRCDWSQRQSPAGGMTPLLQQAIQLLQLSTLELRRSCEQELRENPLLEEVTRRSNETHRRRPHGDRDAPSFEPPPSESPLAKEQSTVEEEKSDDLPFDLTRRCSTSTRSGPRSPPRSGRTCRSRTSAARRPRSPTI